ncbi:dethiobiotin synthase [Ruminococcus albus]|uniref:ATP-dependent dethiobiotin synthetase BioD n=1 Tax=Ruminococcus albus TaxID=1264 RepID=A0A1H7QHB0_RUMAL|nr:dethiobiotin synthase [Ruminococcus albus]SEL47323.1 dethiobiotin synthetase [Ruminococcus albus]
MSKGIFVTGTGTDTGKTYITGLLLKKMKESGYSCAYYKAAMSGNERDSNGVLIPGDAFHVKTVSKIDQPLEAMCPYVYETAVSPHLASRIEGFPLEMDIVKENYLRLIEKYDIIVAEGSGGILCPLRYDDEKIFLEDVINLLGLPCIIVADAGLGTINSVVLTVSYMKSRNIPIKGIILNRFHNGDVMEEDNKEMCEALTGIPVITCIGDNYTDLDISGEDIASLCK